MLNKSSHTICSHNKSPSDWVWKQKSAIRVWTNPSRAQMISRFYRFQCILLRENLRFLTSVSDWPCFIQVTPKSIVNQRNWEIKGIIASKQQKNANRGEGESRWDEGLKKTRWQHHSGCAQWPGGCEWVGLWRKPATDEVSDSLFWSAHIKSRHWSMCSRSMERTQQTKGDAAPDETRFVL